MQQNLIESIRAVGRSLMRSSPLPFTCSVACPLTGLVRGPGASGYRNGWSSAVVALATIAYFLSTARPRNPSARRSGQCRRRRDPEVRAPPIRRCLGWSFRIARDRGSGCRTARPVRKHSFMAAATVNGFIRRKARHSNKTVLFLLLALTFHPAGARSLNRTDG